MTTAGGVRLLDTRPIDLGQRKLGRRLEAETIDALAGIGRVPAHVARWHDAVCHELVVPAPPTVPVDTAAIERGTRLEIKYARLEISNGAGSTTSGRWYVKRPAHQRLCEHDGVYLLGVYTRERVQRAAWITATGLDNYIESWTQTPDSHGGGAVAKLSWRRIFPSIATPEG